MRCNLRHPRWHVLSRTIHAQKHLVLVCDWRKAQPETPQNAHHDAHVGPRRFLTPEVNVAGKVRRQAHKIPLGHNVFIGQQDLRQQRLNLGVVADQGHVRQHAAKLSSLHPLDCFVFDISSPFPA